MHNLNKEQLYRKLNEGIIEERLRAFYINLNKNKPLIKACGGISSVVPQLKGKHICVLAAGPSLQRSYRVLRKFQHRQEIALIAVDMAFLPLYRQGIVPKYVISCETLPVDFFGDAETKNIHLIAFSCMSALNVRKWKGPVHFFNWMVSGKPFDDLWDEAGRELGAIATGNLVTTQAVALALGCQPASIFIAGNDLAFGKNYYTRGTVSHIARLRIVHRFFTIEAAEEELIRKSRHYEIVRAGHKYYTNHQFFAAKEWLEDLLSKKTVPVYDASEPGISGKFVEKINPDEYFAQFDRRPQRRRK
ncbi:MAG: DUF115 domain-containing protein [Spirochaetes bacterium]|nr:DUF115 domain-containing protein [Spirochaetota bacterium]